MAEGDYTEGSVFVRKPASFQVLAHRIPGLGGDGVLSAGDPAELVGIAGV